MDIRVEHIRNLFTFTASMNLISRVDSCELTLWLLFGGEGSASFGLLYFNMES
jgi:hypothetical protein